MTTPHRFSKHFTTDEANPWLPRLRELFRELQDALDTVEGDLLSINSRVERRGNGGGIDVDIYFTNDAVIQGALDEIQNAGIVIQDARRGLVDFPHLMDGREVFLCWELADDDTISWYHEIEAGFAGRRALP